MAIKQTRGGRSGGVRWVGRAHCEAWLPDHAPRRIPTLSAGWFHRSDESSFVASLLCRVWSALG